jgi:hypothetical protein
MKNIFTSSCSIFRPAPEVFSLLCQPDKFPHFMPAIKAASWEDESPLQVGKAYLETREAFGKRATARVYISQFEAGVRIAYKSMSTGVTGEYVYTVIDDNGASKIIVEAFAEAAGFAKLILPLFTNAMKKNDSNQLNAMKNFLEHS